jgi:hypothetical protein
MAIGGVKIYISAFCVGSKDCTGFCSGCGDVIAYKKYDVILYIDKYRFCETPFSLCGSCMEITEMEIIE